MKIIKLNLLQINQFKFGIFRYFYLFILLLSLSYSQNFIAADPYYLLQTEIKQFNGLIPISSNVFRPIFYNTDSNIFKIAIRTENYFNDNSPNQENKDVRYFSKGTGSFKSLLLAFNSKYVSLIAEPYLITNNYKKVDSINRDGIFSVLNDRPLVSNNKPSSTGFRNLLAFLHINGIGFGWHAGNRWWGPGIHTSFQMTNNTAPIPSQIIGTIKEIRIGKLGIYGLYSFSNLSKNNNNKALSKYFTSINAQLSWYSSFILSLGLSRVYLSGGSTSSNYSWSESDAKQIVFEGFFTSNLINNEYTIGGHDEWDQTLSTYVTLTFPKRKIKLYGEFGFNDNRMYYADFLSQPDHSMATIFGVRDYGIGKNNNLLWGFEWTNLIITYSSRHRVTGPGVWYNKNLYDYSTYKGRRWGAHSGSDSDDWYIYAGYLSDNLMIVPALNYERHGVVSHRPAEVKIELRLDMRYKYKNTWFGIYFEKQYESFLGFPNYFYEETLSKPVDINNSKLANTRQTNTLIISLSKNIF